ncbi:MAG TPA: ATP-dependent helicase [Anaerolineae bacterium]|nr:ATP-dependent helicase [Anaerolineae bacterium]
MTFTPRSDQQPILDFLDTGGYLGVSAVPGSGKTHILSALAARLVAEKIRGEEEVLIVTFANSAVDNFARRIRAFLQHGEKTLLPEVGYRVRTLHGLAHDILRERPALLGLPEDFDILDERVSDQILKDTTANWLRGNPQVFDAFVDQTLDENRRRYVAREKWPELAATLARSFIRRAKDLQLTPAAARDGLPGFTGPWAIGAMCVDIYEQYERGLRYRGGLDFDDLIRLALTGLQTDSQLLERLRARWPYILEDEAQDSSELQEKTLRLLTARGNWVRVGDPNQSINTTFTTSNINFLRDFLNEPDVVPIEMDRSGRSTARIIALANQLVEWTTRDHPSPPVRAGAFRYQQIQAVPAGELPPNPIDLPDYTVTLYNAALSPEKELELVVKSIGRWLPAHPQSTCAVLVPDNQRGYKVVEALDAANLPHDDLLRSTSKTRAAAKALGIVLRYLSAPLSGPLLAQTYKTLRAHTADEAEDDEALDVLRRIVTGGLRRCDKVEAYLWPRLDLDWLADYKPAKDDPAVRAELIDFRRTITYWLEASSQLPIDQLVLTIAPDLYHSDDLDQAARDLALAHKLAVVLRQIANEHPDYRLPDLAGELDRVANNQQKFLGFGEDDLGYEAKPGQVTVATMHKAKGLEWDRVYLLGVNNYDFPSNEAHDTYRGETWYIRDGLNLEAEAIAQAEALEKRSDYFLGMATQKARTAYVAERLRLLYVGITRATRELIMTWNTGSRDDNPRQPAAPFLALFTFAETLKTSDAE